MKRRGLFFPQHQGFNLQQPVKQRQRFGRHLIAFPLFHNFRHLHRTTHQSFFLCLIEKS